MISAKLNVHDMFFCQMKLIASTLNQERSPDYGYRNPERRSLFFYRFFFSVKA